MADALAQILDAITAASILLTIYYVGRRGERRPHRESRSGR
ncbi:MAG TPA: hypothetical protein VKA66_05365 [Mycobacterium sp.]|jgi:hypothetical protein|nr:hypothetical protein [Mycobacterium sp.]HKI39821.1 hypothetical protein [Mycobacterium sp.]